MLNQKVLLIGGGTGGHIMPLLPLAQELKHKGAGVSIICADQPLDKKIIQENFPSDIHSYYIKTGKIRRYFSWQNFKDAILIIKAIKEARNLLKKLQPDIIFFKGGFVCFPFLIAIKTLSKKPEIYLHNSDIVISKLSKKIEKSATKVFNNFGENSTPLFFCESPDPHIEETPNHILIFGGSQGAVFLNDLVTEELLEQFKVTLITGLGKQIPITHPNLAQYEMLSNSELIQAMQMSDFVIARSGASIFQIFALHKPSLLIPLPSAAQDHQLKNAQDAKARGLAFVLEQKNFNRKTFLPLLQDYHNRKDELRDALNRKNVNSQEEAIAKVLLKY